MPWWRASFKWTILNFCYILIDCASAALESNELNCPCWSWSQDHTPPIQDPANSSWLLTTHPFPFESNNTYMPIRAQLKSLGPTLTQAEDIWGTCFRPGIWSQSTCILDGFLAFSSGSCGSFGVGESKVLNNTEHVSTLATAWHSFTMSRALALKCLWGSECIAFYTSEFRRGQAKGPIAGENNVPLLPFCECEFCLNWQCAGRTWDSIPWQDHDIMTHICFAYDAWWMICGLKLKLIACVD